MARNPLGGCPVCGAANRTVIRKEFLHRHTASVGSSAVKSDHVATAYTVQCDACGEEWTVTIPVSTPD
jgi:hypothetical protein